jgi:cytosine/adenosine deaminase-related metal-dependent hydrolase
MKKKSNTVDLTQNPVQPDAQVGTSRRELLKGGAGVVAGVAMAQMLPSEARAAQPNANSNAEVLAQLSKSNADKNRSILLKGGTVITMDPAVPDLVKGDVLIQGKKIAAVGADLGAAASGGKTVLVDASGTIVIPGLVDCHQHSWEGALRNIIPDGRIAEYTATTHQGFGPYYRPHDNYVGNLVIMLDAIDAGTTCVIDNSHNSRSAAHSDACIQALFDSGIRAVHASGAPQFGTWDQQWPQDLVRIKQTYFSSDDQLVTLRMFTPVNQANWEFARQLGLWTHTEGSPSSLFQMAALGLLDEKHAFNHNGNTPQTTLQLIKDAGAQINYAFRSDSQYELSNGIPFSIDTALKIGLRPGLGVDNEISYGGSMFAEMRAAFHIQRAFDQYRRTVLNDPNPALFLKVRDCLEFATICGARNAALANKIGTLTPGKEADIVLIRADDVNTFPLNNAVGIAVHFTDRKNVYAVFIAGKLKKWDGQLLDQDLNKVRQLVEESRSYLFAQKGYTLNILS